MTDDLYERYKDALKTGHLAVLRGSFESAIGSYRLAAEIAPTRALPHTSLGSVYLRLGRPEDALSEFDAAVSCSPHDEGALLGQAEALTSSGRRGEAAAALDHVAEIQEASGRLPEAADTLRRAIELEKAPDRIRRQHALVREIRFAAGDQAAEQLLARALRLLDEPVPEPAPESQVVAPAPGPAAPPAEVEGETGPIQLEPAVAPVEAQPLEPEPAAAVEAGRVVEPEEAVGVSSGRLEAGPAPEATAVAKPVAGGYSSPIASEPREGHVEPQPGAQPPAVEPVRGSGETPAVGVMNGIEGPGIAPAAQMPANSVGERGRGGDELLAAAEMADRAGDSEALHSLLLETGRAYAQEGRYEAALDATHRLLSRSPGDVDAHLLLVELYVARSWDGLAVEKLRLLGRLADLNDDAATRRRLREVATATFPEDPSLETLCS